MRATVIKAYIEEANHEEGWYHSVNSLVIEPNVSGRARRDWKRGQHPPLADYATITDRWGKKRTVSELQYKIGAWLDKQKPGTRFTQRLLADSLGVNASSVNRALLLMQAFGLFAFVSKRGRYGGTWLVIAKHVSWRERARRAW